MIIKTRALRAAALVSLAMPLCACTVTSVKSETHAGLAPDHIERTTGDVKLSDASLATSALQSGDISLASSLYAKTLEQRPNDVDALIGMGTTLADAGDFERARETYRHAIAVAPKRTEPVLELARLDLRQRRLDEAIALYRQLLSREPASRFASAGLGTAYAVKGDARAAQETFEGALRAHPGDVMLTIDGCLMSSTVRCARARICCSMSPGSRVRLRRHARTWRSPMGCSATTTPRIRC